MRSARQSKAFRERERKRGWVGAESAAQPEVEDRLCVIVARDMQVALGHPVRITRIVHGGKTTLYHLSDHTIITAPEGARITWEEQ